MTTYQVWTLVLIYQAQTLGKFTKHKPCVNLPSANPVLSNHAQTLC